MAEGDKITAAAQAFSDAAGSGDAKMVARRAVYTAVDIALSGGTTSLQQLAQGVTCADGAALDAYILAMLGDASTGAATPVTGQGAGYESWSGSDDGRDEVLRATITCRAPGYGR